MSDVKDLKMKFSFGALKEIKEVLDIDLMNEDGEAEKDEIKSENFQRMAQAAFRHSGPGVSEKEAEEASGYVTLAEVVEAVEKSFGANRAKVSE